MKRPAPIHLIFELGEKKHPSLRWEWKGAKKLIEQFMYVCNIYTIHRHEASSKMKGQEWEGLKFSQFGTASFGQNLPSSLLSNIHSWKRIAIRPCAPSADNVLDFTVCQRHFVVKVPHRNSSRVNSSNFSRDSINVTYKTIKRLLTEV